ncbi:hypothetical protein KAR91_63375 [Candidatus Pacearchaeota archaeon]|nr:hypothetical protein [Candidatus Pacearchaeota archaeon]
MIKVRGDVYKKVTDGDDKLVKQIGIGVTTEEQLSTIKAEKEGSLPDTKYIKWVAV